MKPCSFNAYPNNWLGSARVASMLPEQEGAYFRLLCYQWNSEDQTIPANDEDLANLSRLNSRWATLGSKVRACFDPLPDNPAALRNERLWHEFCRIAGLRNKQSAGGKQAMANRWHTNDSSHKSLTKSLITGNREQRTENRERDQRAGDGDARGGGAAGGEFDEFWKAYPRKAGKKAALKAWINAKDKPPLSDVLAAIATQRRTPGWTKDGGQYIPHPATWLNQGCWEDKPVEAAQPMRNHI
jgi:uncharacterized protein YdaU (DUF1376 family)